MPESKTPMGLALTLSVVEGLLAVVTRLTRGAGHDLFFGFNVAEDACGYRLRELLLKFLIP